MMNLDYLKIIAFGATLLEDHRAFTLLLHNAVLIVRCSTTIVMGAIKAPEKIHETACSGVAFYCLLLYDSTTPQSHCTCNVVCPVGLSL